MKKNIYFIDINPMNASLILETLKAYIKDKGFEANLKMILANIDKSISCDQVEFYQKFCCDRNISFEHIQDFDSLKNFICFIDNKESLVLLNPFMNEETFDFCRNLLNFMNIKFELVATCPWYEEENKFNSKIERFKESYKQNTGEVTPKIFAGQNLRLNNFVENEAKRLLKLN